MKNFIGYIYVITNNVNQKQYIGQTRVSIKKRWLKHKSSSKKNIYNLYLYTAMNHYGIANFDIHEVCNVVCNSKDELMRKLDELEILYISQYNTLKPNGYNMTRGGCEPPNKFPEMKVIQYDVDYNKLNIFNSMTEASEITGIQQSDISKCCNKKLITAGGYIWTFENEQPDKTKKPQRKPVNQYTLEGVLINKYNSIKQASDNTNIDVGSISLCCNKKGLTGGGFKWSFCE